MGARNTLSPPGCSLALLAAENAPVSVATDPSHPLPSPCACDNFSVAIDSRGAACRMQMSRRSAPVSVSGLMTHDHLIHFLIRQTQGILRDNHARAG
jgi:hypothetical protein